MSDDVTLQQIWESLSETQQQLLLVAAVFEGSFTSKLFNAVIAAIGIEVYGEAPSERTITSVCRDFHWNGLFDSRTKISEKLVPTAWIYGAKSGLLPAVYAAVSKLDKRSSRDVAYRRIRRNLLFARFSEDVDLLRATIPDALRDPYSGKTLTGLYFASARLVLSDTPFGTLWRAYELVVDSRNATTPLADPYTDLTETDTDGRDLIIPAAICEAAFYRADSLQLERLDLAYGDLLPAKAFIALLKRDYANAAETYDHWYASHRDAYLGFCSGRFLRGMFSALTGVPDIEENRELKEWGLKVLHPDQVFGMIAEAKRTATPVWHGDAGQIEKPPATFLAIMIAIRARALRASIHRDDHAAVWNQTTDGDLYWWMAELGPPPRDRHALESTTEPLPPEVSNLLDDDGRGPVAAGPFAGAGWKHQLKVLEEFLNQQISPKSGSKNAGPQKTSRIAWLLIENQFQGGINFEPREQTLRKNGTWSKGKKISLKRFCKAFTEQLPDAATEFDEALSAGLKKVSYGYSYYSRSQDDCEVDYATFLPALAEHPLVFHADNPSTTVTIQVQEPRLTISKTADGHQVELDPMPDGDETEVMFIWDSHTRLRAILFNKKHRDLADLLEREQFVIPDEGATQLAAIQTNAETIFQVDSDLAASGDNTAEEADLTIHVLTEPEENGLVFSVRVDPAQSGQYLCPGEGATGLSRQDKEGPIRVIRNLEKEQKIAESAVFTALRAGPTEDWDWFYPDPSDALAALAGFHDQEDQGVKLVWPRGTPIRVTPKVESTSLTIRMEDDTDWFACSGELQVSPDLSVGLGDLLALMTNRVGNFIPISDGHYVQLTDHLRRQLQQMSHAESGKSKGTKARFHQILAVENTWLDEMGNFKPSLRWRYLRDKVDNWQAPSLPATLEADLRPYQIEGFQWLAQHTALGLGACLADDMGLGKTLQTIAVALLHAEEGPTLVIAPTSVCNNWVSEIRKFAPTLRAKSLADASDRDKLVTEAGPFEVVVSSFGLMQTTASITEKGWRLAVIDEAQAIKNPTTQRAKAACAIRAVSRIATTGTPVENHVGELWSLFRFLNPGLLGSLNAFRSRYSDLATAAKERRHLQQTIRPFVLRRTKSQVLDDLPPRTEINLEVALSEQELALYEAIRRKALERISKSNPEQKKGRFTILAEIMRLRRACCHPSLVDSDLAIPGAKLERLLEVVDDLRENKHRALVFSQFVDHLAVIRQALDERKIPYQYLDGSTTAKRRTKAVDAFQAGKGDLFLISLKAGGVGLNLTGADYVIHMDPWWNPAVEDQASDRAHRIGQTRPVTIYRILAKDTIEEKILDLHARKRKIADQIISDADGPVSLDELKEMLTARAPMP